MKINSIVENMSRLEDLTDRIAMLQGDLTWREEYESYIEEAYQIMSTFDDEDLLEEDDSNPKYLRLPNGRKIEYMSETITVHRMTIIIDGEDHAADED